MQCPNCEFDAAGQSGWKRHMTMTHGGWSDKQLAQASGLEIMLDEDNVNGNPAMSESEGSHLMGEESFDSFASKLPSDASGLGEQAKQEVSEQTVEEMSEEAREKEKAFRRVQMPRKMRAEMKKLKKKIAEDLPEFFFNRYADRMQQPDWRLSKDEKEAISDSVNMVLEVLDVDFAIEPLSMTLTSIWWVLLYPVGVILGIFMLKQSEIMKKENPLAETETVN